MAKKSKKKASKNTGGDLQSQLKETVLQAPAHKELPPTVVSKPKAKGAKKGEETLISPPRNKLPVKPATSSRLMRLRSSLRMKQESSLAPSFLSTQHPMRGGFPWDPIRKIQAIILATFLVLGGGIFLFADRLHSSYDKASLRMSSWFDWRTWSSEVFTQKNEAPMTTEKPYEQLLAPKNRDLVSPPSDVQTTLVGDSQVAVLDDSLPKTPIEKPKKVNAKKDNPKSKATVNKKKPAKKKELSGKKATNRKTVSKSPKSKKAH